MLTAAVIAPYYYAARPASVVANPTLLAFSIFGLLGGALLSLDSIWQNVHQLIEDPHSRRHPLTIHRARIALSALGVLLFIGPDAIQFTAWPDVAPATRYAMGIVNRYLDSVAIVPFTLGWALGIYAGPTISYQLDREPIPVNLWPSWHDLRRPLWIATLLACASVALSFGR